MQGMESPNGKGQLNPATEEAAAKTRAKCDVWFTGGFCSDQGPQKGLRSVSMNTRCETYGNSVFLAIFLKLSFKLGCISVHSFPPFPP